MIDEELVARPPRAGALARPPGHARHGPEPGRLLPGPRGGQPVLPGAAGHRPADDGPLRRPRRPAVPPVRLRRRARRRARDRDDGLGRRGRRGGGRARWSRGARRSALVKVRLYRPFDAAAFLAALPPTVRSHRRAGPHQGAGRARRAALPGRRHRPGRGLAGDGDRRRSASPGSSAGATACPPRSSRRPWSKAVFDELAQARAEEPLHRRHRRRRHAHQPDVRPRASTSSRTTSCAPSSTGSAPTARSAPTRTRSRSSARRRRNYAQGYFVYDSKKSGSVDGLAPALRPAPDPLHLPDRAGELRRLPPVRLPGALRRAGGGRARRHVPAEQPLSARTRSGTTCRARSRSRSSTSGCGSTSIDALRGGARGRHGRPHQHGHADLLLRAQRRPAARRGDRRRSRRRSRRPTASAARPSCSRTSPPSTARWRTSTRWPSRTGSTA